MSTVIRNGYRLPDMSTLEEVMAWVNPLRKILTQHATDELKARVIRRALALFDQDTARAHGRIMGGEGAPNGNCVLQAMRSIRDEVLEARKENRHCDLDPSVRLSIIPSKGQVFGMLFSELPGIPKAFQSQLGVEEYQYTNQVDGPPHMTASEWDIRGERWSELLGPTGRPSDVGMEVVLVNSDLIYCLSGPSSDVDLAVLSDEKSVRARAQRVALSTPAARLPVELLAEYKRTQGIGVWVRHHMALMAGESEAFNKEVELLQSVLIPSLTIEQLTSGQESSPRPSTPGPGRS